MSDVVGAVLGLSIGERLRRAYFRRKLRGVRAGRDVRVRARLHPKGSPEWRHWRGAVVRSAGSLRWRDAVRRWRTVDLSAAEVVGTRVKRSAGGGESVIIALAAVPRADHLAVSCDRAPVVEELLRMAGGHTSSIR